MPTFNPAPFDPTKPETQPAVPTTADQRGQHVNGNTAFTAAHADVTALEGHVATGDIHVDHTTVDITAGAGLTGGGTIELSRSLAVGAGEGITVNANDVAAAWGGAGGDFGAATTVARSDHAHAALYEPVGALRNVIEDTSPQLGGDLETKGNNVLLSTSSDTIQGLVGPFDSGAGAVFAYSDDGSYITDDGAVTVEPGVVSVYGAAVTVPGLKHGVPGGRQVYVNEVGILYGVDPPEPGWFDADADPGNYLRSGVGLNVWQRLTGLQLTAQQAVQLGDPLDVSASVFTNNTTARTGTVEIGFGVNGAQPTNPGDPFQITAFFQNYMTTSFRTTTTALGQNDTIEIWVRVTQESNSQFSAGLQFDGGGGTTHEASMGVAAGGSGVTTFTGLTDTPADYVGQGSKLVSVRSDATGLEFTDPPTGSGDVTSTNPTVDGEIQVGDTTSKGIKGAGFQGATVARLDIAQTFQGTITLDGPTDVDLIFTSGGELRFVDGANYQHAFSTPANNFQIKASSDGLSRDRDIILDAQVVNVPAGELQEAGNRTLTVAGGRTIGATGGFASTPDTSQTTTINPDPLTGQHLALSTGSHTINTLANDGFVKVFIANAASVSLSGYVEVNSETTGRDRAVLLERSGSIHLATWQ